MKRRRRHKPHKRATNKYEEEAKLARDCNHRLRSCERKRRYETMDDACQKGMVVYHCDYCGGWHRGTEPSRKMLKHIRQLARLKHR